MGKSYNKLYAFNNIIRISYIVIARVWALQVSCWVKHEATLRIANSLLISIISETWLALKVGRHKKKFGATQSSFSAFHYICTCL